MMHGGGVCSVIEGSERTRGEVALEVHPPTRGLWACKTCTLGTAVRTFFFFRSFFFFARTPLAYPTHQNPSLVAFRQP